MRTPIIAANWKMQMTRPEAQTFAAALAPLLDAGNPVEIVIAPPFTALAALGSALEGAGIESSVALAAQNVHPEPAGAFTGEISVAMLAELGCSYAILGHSERRALFGESSAFVAEKFKAVEAGGLRSILCVGETLEDREAGRTNAIVAAQLEESLALADASRASDWVIAYEPVWAIGTGRTATPEMAQEVHAFIRAQLVKHVGAAAEQIRIQYGGSVKPDKVAALMAQPDIDGALVGGASLDPESFSAIIHFHNSGRE
jgi:triosephosphate isomerase